MLFVGHHRHGVGYALLRSVLLGGIIIAWGHCVLTFGGALWFDYHGVRVSAVVDAVEDGRVSYHFSPEESSELIRGVFTVPSDIRALKRLVSLTEGEILRPHEYKPGGYAVVAYHLDDPQQSRLALRWVDALWSLAVVGLASLVLILFLRFISSLYHINSRRFDDVAVVTGTITRVFSADKKIRGIPLMCFEYEFQDRKGQSYTGTTDPMFIFRADNHKPGMDIVIHYSVSCPGKNFWEEDGKRFR
jgi:hypothetical protein